MTEQKSFKERVKETVIQNAYSYKKYFVDYEYLLFSTAFVNNEYYIVSAYNDNYLHLTGLHTSLNASDFFEKCYTKTLEECDFDFCKSGQNESEVKGSVRRKINSLPTIMDIFNVGTFVEEEGVEYKMPEQGIMIETPASVMMAEELAELWVEKFEKSVEANTKSISDKLLKGNELDSAKAKKLDLVFRRKSGENRFTEMLIGDEDRLLKHKNALSDLLSEELLSIINTDVKAEE